MVVAAGLLVSLLVVPAVSAGPPFACAMSDPGLGGAIGAIVGILIGVANDSCNFALGTTWGTCDFVTDQAIGQPCPA